MRVLDLMSSWQSHIPDNVYLKELTGLGLNREELERNDLLCKWFVHDLNLYPILPFKNNEFDAAICTVSIEYIIYPDDIFHEFSRILRPGGVLIIAFSNRWFPPKAIQIWKDLHEFERMGLVLEYFERSGKFENLETYSLRGLPRPWDDKYFPERRYSDPIFAVWGKNKLKNC
jgi:SAM-dependent methyltransferase